MLYFKLARESKLPPPPPRRLQKADSSKTILTNLLLKRTFEKLGFKTFSRDHLKDVILISAYIYSMLSLFHKRLFMEFLHSSAQIITGFFKCYCYYFYLLLLLLLILLSTLFF